MKVCCIPFIINHSHPPFIRLPCRKTGVVKEPRSDGKHSESQCNESRVESRCLGIVSVVHQDVVLSQERRFIHHGKQKVEAGEISLYLFPIGNGQIRLHHKRPDKGDAGKLRGTLTKASARSRLGYSTSSTPGRART